MSCVNVPVFLFVRNNLWLCWMTRQHDDKCLARYCSIATCACMCARVSPVGYVCACMRACIQVYVDH